MAAVVGLDGKPVDISPPGYKDPVKMLRAIADEIEAGKYGDVETVVVGLSGDTYESFSGGPDSNIEHSAFLFQACATRLHNTPWGGS